MSASQNRTPDWRYSYTLDELQAAAQPCWKPWATDGLCYWPVHWVLEKPRWCVPCWTFWAATPPRPASPSYVLHHTYNLPQGHAHHLDLYRLETPEAAWGVGLEELFDSGDWVWVEWPERLGGPPASAFAWVHLEILGPESREIRLYLLS